MLLHPLHGMIQTPSAMVLLGLCSLPTGGYDGYVLGDDNVAAYAEGRTRQWLILEVSLGMMSMSKAFLIKDWIIICRGNLRAMKVALMYFCSPARNCSLHILMLQRKNL